LATDRPEPSAREFLEAARGPARELAAEIRTRYRPRDPALRRPGHARGVDVYSEEDLEVVVTTILGFYRRSAGRYPDLLSPRLYSEKVNALKLFAHVKVPETGDKLKTASFLTPEARTLLQVPEVLWQSATPRLPPDDAIPPGEYLLKANHGSGRCRRIRYPLPPATRAALEALAAKWLAKGYGVRGGEWWYNVFTPRLLLERCVTRRNPSAAMLFFLFHGEVASIYVDEKLLDGSNRTRAAVFDPDFRLLPEQPGDSEPLHGFAIPADMKSRAIAAARSIGRTFEAVRVDIIPGDAGDLYLNEITLTNYGGMPLTSLRRDEELGEMWGRCSFLR